MNKKIQTLTGMNDILPDEVSLWQFIEKTARDVFDCYGFSEIRVPLLEDASLFSRSIGEATEVVQKEMYTFKDKGDDLITLRPEGTAGVVRAYVQHSLQTADAITKLYYMGPMFRYERPQKGRLRQFHQIGAELFGVDSPIADAEVVILLDRFVKKLGIENYRLEINTLGTMEERKPYLKKLVTYFTGFKDKLCKDCHVRLEKNPQRIFDCKNEPCKIICQEAPLLLNELSAESSANFESFKKYLSEAEVEFTVNPHIVRGLDYYEKTAFEFVSSELGSQSAFAGGGRYNRLVKELGGPDVPAVGFALGCERLVLLLKSKLLATKNLEGVYLIPFQQDCWAECHKILLELRDEGIKSEMDYELKSVKSQMRRANKLGFKYAAFMGENEIKKGIVTLKDLQTGDQTEVDTAILASDLRKRIK